MRRGPLLQKNTLQSELLRYLAMIGAFAVMSLGMVAMVNAGVGTPPWDVLHLGLSKQLGFSYGQVIQGVGLIMVVVSWLLKIKPHVGTILNMFFIGLFVDLYSTAGFVPRPGHLALSLLQLVGGIVVFAYGTAVYIIINRGTGPRDSFMIALARITGLRMGLVRTIIEVLVTLTGFLLGGPLGLGTVIFALTVGPFMELFFKVARFQQETVRRYMFKQAVKESGL
jgi:uncharacterized protein